MAPWLVSVPLMLAGTEVAHWLAFRLVYPNPYQRGLVLAQTGHSYFSWLPLIGGLGCAILVSALVMHGRGSARCGIETAAPRLSRFAVLPPLAFALQEHIESLITNGTPIGVVNEPTFLPGVVLTLPFAVLAYVAARLLLRVAARVFRRPAVFVPARLKELVKPVYGGVQFAPRVRALAAGHAERGPPL